MRTVSRSVGLILFLTLLTTPFTLFSQDDDTITVIGSRIVTDAFTSITSTIDIDNEVEIAPTGTTTGFEQFCQGEADITGATRPISVDEETLCTQNEIEFTEYLLGYDGVALIAHPELEPVTCLRVNDLNNIFAPSAENTITEWSQISVAPEEISDPISIFLPPDDSPVYFFFDSLVEGLSLRRDVTTEADPTALIDSVRTIPGAIGVVSLSVLTDDIDVHVIELNNPDLGDCFTPNLETIEQRQYPAANRLLIYVNQAQTEKPGLGDILALLASESTAAAVTEAGLVAPSTESYALNQAILAGEEDTGRQFSLEVVEFEIPPDVFGEVNIGGAANLFRYINDATTQFNAQYPGVTINVDIEGEPSGLRRFCNGEVNILTNYREIPALEDFPQEVLDALSAAEVEAEVAPEATAEITPEATVEPGEATTPAIDPLALAAQNCEANNITPYTLDLGKRAVVLVANAEADYLTCLTTEQLFTTWQSSSSEMVVNWSDVDINFPDEELFLFAPSTGQGYTDLLLTPADGVPVPIRLDVAEENRDPLYRAAATANVPGALTFMSWQEYQDVLENEQENIQLISIDAGDGCVTPSEETILDGSYPITEDNKLIVNRGALARSEIQSLIWYLFSDANYFLIENAGLIGLEFGNLPLIRGELQEIFSDVATILEDASQDTPAPFAEATPDIQLIPELPSPGGDN